MESVVNHDEETLGRALIGGSLENGNYCTVSQFSNQARLSVVSQFDLIS